MSNAFAREAELCAAFLGALPEGWVAYPETGGFDILLVRDADGFQIGIEAKLRLNARVIRQVCEANVPDQLTGPNPDCRAVLVPHGTAGADLIELCKLLGITVVTVGAGQHPTFTPALPRPGQDAKSKVWFELSPSQRVALPDYVPDVEAGAARPLRLTAWKIKAIRIAVTLERRGFVLRDDFKHHQISMQRWIAPRFGWLLRQERGWGRGPHLPDFRAQHPKNWEQIGAGYDRWRLPDAALAPEP